MNWFAALILLPLISIAAPIPATTSSLLISESPGLYQSPLGFRIDAAKTGWELIEPPNKNPHIATVYRDSSKSSGVQGALTVRIDQRKNDQNITAYAKQWIKDYPRLGFEILNSKKITLNKNPGYLLDVISRDNHIQLRQVLFLRNKHIVNLTCRDHQDQFAKTLRSCNEIIRTFRW